MPEVRDKAWARTPIDAFILAALEAKGLQPAPASDRRVLLRRVTLDLTGLPPSPEDYTSFINDTSPDAFAKVVDGFSLLNNMANAGGGAGSMWLVMPTLTASAWRRSRSRTRGATVTG